jgi:hypothetical protein
MGLRNARPKIKELKNAIQSRFPDVELHEGWGFEGGPKDVYVYAYATEDKMDDIIEMSSPRILNILLKTDIFVHVIPLFPGTMTWLWNDGKKGKKRVSTRALAPRRVARSGSHVLAEPRATYKVEKSAARRKAVRKT